VIAIRGADSAIARAVVKLLPGVAWINIHRDIRPESLGNADRFLFCQGLLRPSQIADQSDDEIAQSLLVNAGSIIAACDRIVAANGCARICVIGSESGYSGSFDGAYAAGKAALHSYVETKQLRTPAQQLVAIAPGIIEDAAMTQRRLDQDNLTRLRQRHPKGRFLFAAEVAGLVHHVLYVDGGYLSGVVIRMNGGAHTCRG
jgi:NAD(P)-dependent dehydrogenase (short-subunit alcohol dehydrogenase family)